jgi:hypothetical protein
MNSGDSIQISEHDTAAGFRVTLDDLTTGQSGFMTASVGNGFGQVKFDPHGSGCTLIPYAFHPMYSTSSPATRVPWAAHSYNVAFSDEIGHFELCNAVNNTSGLCTKDGVHDTDNTIQPIKNDDDIFCLPARVSTRIAVTGCAGTDVDFSGPSYFLTWPGTNPNPVIDQTTHPQPIRFTGPVFRPASATFSDDSLSRSSFTNYDRVAFEADLPRIELATIPPCDRTTGANCVNPPPYAAFYPIFTTGSTASGACVWQLGGKYIPGTMKAFGGTSTIEYGPLLTLFYPNNGFVPIYIIEDFHNTLANNPCPAPAS